MRKTSKQTRKLTEVEQLMLRVAQDTLKMPDELCAVLGGPTKAEAKRIIRRLTAKE